MGNADKVTAWAAQVSTESWGSYWFPALMLDTQQDLLCIVTVIGGERGGSPEAVV